MSTHEMTTKILDVFAQISAIPRRSKEEEQICQWLVSWAEANGFATRTDTVNNLVIRVPATPGHEAAPTVVLQGHMDMVCEKTPDSDHDFTKDPIRLVYDGEWLKADKTTLGADNGIALAMALVAATDEGLVHPPMELLFTVDEETGLTGANAIEPGFLEGKILLNLDSEDEGYLTVGCAGGLDTMLHLPLDLEPLPDGFDLFAVKAGGMAGGHSGVDIHEYRANAIRVLARTLTKLQSAVDARIVDLKGGSAHNAIPRDASAIVAVPHDKGAEAAQVVSTVGAMLESEFTNTDPNLEVGMAAHDAAASQALTPSGTQKALDFIMAIPHGVAAMSTEIDGLVETSNNEATLVIENGTLSIQSSQRSSVMSRLRAHSERIEGIARLAGGTAESGNGYPAWQPNMASALLERCAAIYRDLYDKEPVVEAIHAGLECGIIGSKYDGMDMISFGPTIKNPHSPDEMLHLPSIPLVWDYLAAILASYAAETAA
jgi:dipeptidase D